MREDDADGLEVRVDDGGADESHSPSVEVFRYAIGEVRRGEGVLMNGLAVGETPDVFVETPHLTLDGNEDLGIADGSLDFQFVADDACVLAKFRLLLLVISGDGLIVEAVECSAESFSLVEHALPRQSCLKGFEQQHLEKFVVIVYRYAPLMVVVSDIERALDIAPMASDFGIYCHSRDGLMPQKYLFLLISQQNSSLKMYKTVKTRP